MTHENKLIKLLDKEVPNGHFNIVTANELFHSTEWHETQATLPMMLGKSIGGDIKLLDLAKAPHLLIAGTTGAGKSVQMDLFLCSLMFRYMPNELKLILADPKVVELDKYKKLPYLQLPVINTTEEMLNTLQWLTMEMERRYELLSKAGCRSITELNAQRPGSLPYIVTFINELSDFMAEAKNKMELLLSRLCSKSRAVGIHLVISTQRPDTKVVTECIKTSFPARIAFRTASHIDSKTILDTRGAECLLGWGDMLFRASGGDELVRIQGGLLTKSETARIIECLIMMYGDMKPEPLSHLQGKNPYQATILHDQLANIVHNTLEEELACLKKDVIDDLAVNIADAVIKYLDESRASEADEETQETAEGSTTINEKLSSDERKMLLEAVKIVIESKRPSISYIQRRLRIGYNKATMLMETMEIYGIVSTPVNDSRRILVNSIEEAKTRLPI